MKLYIKYTALVLLFSFLISCNSEGEGEDKFKDQPETGWVEFSGTLNEITITQGVLTSIEIPVEINAPINSSDLVVSYTIRDIVGSSSTLLESLSGTMIIPGSAKEGLLNLGLLNTPISSNTTFEINLISTDRNGVTAGIADAQRPTSFRVTVLCPINSSKTYIGDVASPDIGLPFNTFPTFTATLTPANGLDYTWDIDTVWGPNFVFFLTNGGAPQGSFPYPAQLTLNPNTLDVTITGNEFYTSGGTGTYNTCTDTFSLNISQTLFNGTFTVDVILKGNLD